MWRRGWITSHRFFLFTSFPKGDKRDVDSQRDGLTSEHVILCLSPVVNLSLTPYMVVELVPQHIEQGHHWHVEKEEAHQTSSAEVPKKGIHPNPNRQVHPYNPTEHVQRERKETQRCCLCHIILYCLVWRNWLVQTFTGFNPLRALNWTHRAHEDVG